MELNNYRRRADAAIGRWARFRAVCGSCQRNNFSTFAHPYRNVRQIIYLGNLP